jgi:hypothetical protein
MVNEEKEEAHTPRQLQLVDETQSELLDKKLPRSDVPYKKPLQPKTNRKRNLIFKTGDDKKLVLKNSKESNPELDNYKRAGLTA